MKWILVAIVCLFSQNSFASPSEKREEQFFLAQLSEQAGRFEDMAEAMKSLVLLGEELTPEERQLFSIAYRNLVGARRTSWRSISEVEQKTESDARPRPAAYRMRVEKELKEICSQVIHLLDEYLIPTASSSESLVFFYKMKGDYYRYMAEIEHSADRKSTAEGALIAYNTANDLAVSDLEPTHPIRLGLELNRSVFFYEIQNSPDRAIQMAKHAYDLAIHALSQDSEYYQETVGSLYLIRDNLMHWTNEMTKETD